MHRFAALAALAAGVGVAQAQGTLYGVATFSNFGTQSLYAINPATGAASLIGNTGLRQIAGLDWDQSSNQLIALTVGGDQFSLNTATGASTLLVDANFGVPEGSIAFRNGTAFTTIFDNVHSWNGASWQLLGNSGLAAGADISGLDFTATRLLGLALNGTAGDELVSFDLTTGAASIIGATGTNASTVAGLAFDFNAGGLFMTDGSSLYSLNEGTGSATLIGSHGLSGFSGLAYVPAPGTMVLLAGTGLLASRRRR
jgi:hypothetical protein